MKFFTGESATTTERLRITEDGEVGINKSSPNAGVKLHVGGTARFDDDVSIATTKKLFTNSSQGQLTIQGGATYPGSAIKFAGGQSGTTDQGQMIFYAGTATSLEERLRIYNNGEAAFKNGISFGGQNGHSNDESMRMHMYSDSSTINDGVNFTVTITFPNANNGPFMIELFQAHVHYVGTPSYCKVLGAYGASDSNTGGLSFLTLEKQGNIDNGSVFDVTGVSSVSQRTANTDFTVTITGKSASSGTGTSLKCMTYVIVHSRTIPGGCTFAEV